ncbi:MAG: PQQ-binding-like beta-propeller repeat protein [Bacteroidota bacterium]
MKILKNYLLLSCFLLLISFSVSDTETFQWTRFRGSDGSGIDSNRSVPVTWDSTDYRWTITLPGKGNASPVVWGNTIFITSSDDEKNTGYAYAINERNGNILWEKKFNVTDLSMHKDNNLAAPTPAVDESQVYFIWYSKERTNLTALAHDGTVQWEAEFEGIECRHGGGSSLILTDKYVVFTREQEDFSSLKSSWVAVNKQTGRTVWELERESAIANSFSTPLLVETDNQSAQLIFASQAHGLTGVDPERGEVLWERKDIFPARVVASPIYSEGMIIACRKGEAVVFDLNSAKNQLADTERYFLPRNLSPYVPTPIVVGEMLFLFMDNGTVACVVLATGELLWKERPAGAIFGSPICVAGNLYCITKAGEVLVIGADSSYQLLGIHELGEGSFSTPVMCSSGMVLRTFSKLMMLDTSS